MGGGGGEERLARGLALKGMISLKLVVGGITRATEIIVPSVHKAKIVSNMIKLNGEFELRSSNPTKGPDRKAIAA